MGPIYWGLKAVSGMTPGKYSTKELAERKGERVFRGIGAVKVSSSQQLRIKTHTHESKQVYLTAAENN